MDWEVILLEILEIRKKHGKGIMDFDFNGEGRGDLVRKNWTI